MKRTLLAVILFALASCEAYAANLVSQAVFTITSSAKTSTPNLRVVPMTPKTIGRASDGQEIIQSFLWQPNQTQNLYLTKSKTIDLSMALCAWIQVDQATTIKVNSESAYMTLPSGFNADICFK
jgi:hypothetical protein